MKNMKWFLLAMMFSLVSCHSLPEYATEGYRHNVFETEEIGAKVQQYLGKSTEEIEALYGKPTKVEYNNLPSINPDWDLKWAYRIDADRSPFVLKQHFEIFYFKDNQVSKVETY